MAGIDHLMEGQAPSRPDDRGRISHGHFESNPLLSIRAENGALTFPSSTLGWKLSCFLFSCGIRGWTGVLSSSSSQPQQCVFSLVPCSRPFPVLRRRVRVFCVTPKAKSSESFCTRLQKGRTLFGGNPRDDDGAPIGWR